MLKRDPQFQFDTINSVWVIRAGIGGVADNYFMKENSLVLEAQGLGDLNQIEPSREAFYQAYAATTQKKTRTAIAGIGGKFYRFLHEIQIGDIVLYPSLKTGEVCCGQITGKYRYVAKNKEFPHQRKVRWLTKFPKSSLSKAAQYELGAARTLFSYRKNLSEIIDKLKSAQQYRE